VKAHHVSIFLLLMIFGIIIAPNNFSDVFAQYMGNVDPETGATGAFTLEETLKQQRITTHIPGFPDPTKDPQYYVDRYNKEPEYKAWFDRNFPGQSIYQVLRIPEPEPPQCGPGTRLENSMCVLDDAQAFQISKPESSNLICGLGTIERDGFCIPDPQYVKSGHAQKQNKHELERYVPNIANLEIYTPHPQLLIFSGNDAKMNISGHIRAFENEREANKTYQIGYDGWKNSIKWWEINHLNEKCKRTDYTLLCQKNNIIFLLQPRAHHIDDLANFDEDRFERIMLQMLTKSKTANGGCLIATAAYGTELAPQVQLLREFRDNTLFRTSSGTAFMSGFNQFYYSFSPEIADLERQNPIFKEAVKIAITPMLYTLSILNYVGIDSEQDMLGYGIGIILLNVGLYFVIPTVLIYKLKNRKS